MSAYVTAGDWYDLTVKSVQSTRLLVEQSEGVNADFGDYLLAKAQIEATLSQTFAAMYQATVAR